MAHQGFHTAVTPMTQQQPLHYQQSQSIPSYQQPPQQPASHQPPGSKTLAPTAEPTSQNVTVDEATSPSAFRGTMTFALVFALTGLALVIASTQLAWLTFGRDSSSPDFRYSPFWFEECPYDDDKRTRECKRTKFSSCEWIKKLDQTTKQSIQGNFCSLDNALKGLAIIVPIVASIGVVGLGYIITIGVTSRKNAFYVAGGSSMLAVAFGVCAASVNASIKSIPLFSRSGVGVNDENGFFTQVSGFIMFLIAGGIALAQARMAPAPIYPHDPNVLETATPAFVAVAAHSPSATDLSGAQAKMYQQPAQYQSHGQMA
ncbi:hypothetical protein HDU97_004953 [Phlyctochytrium planicorne]|nr:hypothetical protein HDU97_004953 [Phlyctochytrium planicorne]